MTDVADPHDRDDNDVSIVPGLADVTAFDEADLDRDLPEDEDADLYTRTVKAPGVEADERTDFGVTGGGTVSGLGEEGDRYGLGDENTQETAPVEEPVEPNPLVHGLGTAGDEQQRISTEADGDGLEFGLGSENTQDTPPVPEPVEPDPLRHGLGSAEDTIE